MAKITSKTKHDIVLKAVEVKKPKSSKGIENGWGLGPSYPCLYLNADQLPDLKDKDVGEVVTLLVEGKIVSHSKNESTPFGEKKPKTRENFDIQITKMGLDTGK